MKRSTLSLAIAAMSASVPLLAATQAEIDAAAQQATELQSQQQQRLEQQRQSLDGAKAPSGLDVDALTSERVELPFAAGECIELDRLKVSGATLLDEWEVEVLEVPFLGKCITADLASSVLASATDFYISRGFITTRAYLPNQDLNDGVLQVYVAEGQVEEKRLMGDAKSMNLATTFLSGAGEPLTIRDLEQAVDQLNAVPGNDVTMSVLPGTQPQTSQVVFQNAGKPGVQGKVLLDNSGSEATGQNGVSVTLKAGNLLELGEVWTLSARESLSESKKDSESYSLDLRVPYGYNTFGAGISKSGYDTVLVFPTTGTELTSEGASDSAYVSANRVVYRDQNSKHSVDLKLKRDSTESYIADTKIDVSSRSVSSLVLSSESVLGFDRSVLVVTPEISLGLHEVDNLPAGVNTPVENPQAEYLRYRLTLDWNQPFTLADNAMRWQSKLRAQHSSEPLYGSQQLIIGGASSVRGFYDVSASGDQGYFWQNSLFLQDSLSLGSTQVGVEYMLGYDIGRVTSVREGVYEGTLQSATLGASFSLAPWSLEINHGIPLSIDGERDKGDEYTRAVIGLDF